MSTTPMPAGAAAPGRRWRALVWLWRELRIGLPIGVIAAVFISTMFRDPFVRTLIYSLCIGLSIQLLIEAGRYGGVAWLRRRDPLCLPSQSQWPGWAWMGPWMVVSAVAGYFGGSLLADLLTGDRHTRNPFGPDLRPLALILMLSLGFTVSAVYFLYSRGRLAALQVAAEAAQRSAAEAQLKLLQSQLEPHMLFNTLANLRVLIGTDPARAQAMLDRLIAFLRATLAASRSGSHTLADEFALIDDYLALIAVRMGPRLAAHLELPDALRTQPVPALLLQPLVENAVRHGLEPKVDGGRIEVSARRDDGALLLDVRDTGVGLAHDASGDAGRFGLRQVRERLSALFGGRAALTLMPAGDERGGVLASVRLPMP
ncbi:MAG TPA: histidine kinase [Burkholderiaceae bacterium]|nr:histidine kinase [Burkholderiaceae bacterium]